MRLAKKIEDTKKQKSEDYGDKEKVTPDESGGKIKEKILVSLPQIKIDYF